jgi:TfoX/Sxy family transcriptional regulator of competence genes
MAGSTSLVDRVREAFANVPGVAEKKMFGSIAFLVRGNMCVAARSERIMCRVDPARHDELLKRAGSRTVVMRGREYRGYLYVDADAVATKRALRSWIDAAREFNRGLKRK